MRKLYLNVIVGLLGVMVSLTFNISPGRQSGHLAPAQTRSLRLVREGAAGEQKTNVPPESPSVAVNQTQETLAGKLLMGYQGWFACPGDGSPVNAWKHWLPGQTFDMNAITVDMWPDVSMLEPDELCPTGLTLQGGGQAALFSSYNSATVERHFRWMRDYQIDGVMLQRFSSELSGRALFDFRNRVTENVRIGAEANNRVFAIMYDISGTDPAELTSVLMNDWAFLVNDLGVTQSPSYLKHNGKPVLGLWGLGFANRPGTAQQALELINYFRNNPDPALQVSLVGGVPRNWRRLAGENEAWAQVFRSFDVLMPWTVASYKSEKEADEYLRDVVIPDMDEARAAGIAYMPVVFPGFSWRNLSQNTSRSAATNTLPPLNQIPRNGGRFFWRQVYNVLGAGATMIYVAMFDEVDEGTAMFMLAPSKADLPPVGRFVSLDHDGYTLPSDWYLQLAQAAGMMLRQEIPLSPLMPDTLRPPLTPVEPAGATTTNPPTFIWKPVPGAIGYEIQYGDTDPPALTVTTAAARFTPPGRLLIKTYYWRVRAQFGDQDYSGWSTIESVRIESAMSAAPLRNLHGTPPLTLTWNRVTWASEYEVQVDTTAAFTPPVSFMAVVAANILGLPVAGLTDGQYYWRVRARHSDGTWGLWSAGDSFVVDTP